MELDSVYERVLVDRPGVRGAFAQSLTIGIEQIRALPGPRAQLVALGRAA